MCLGLQPDKLRNLYAFADGFLSPILVFCELTNSRTKLTRSTQAGHHFVLGRIGPGKNDNYLGAHAGTRGLIRLSDEKTELSKEDKKRICDVWDWMKNNHPLIKGVNIDEPSDLTNASERPVQCESELGGRRNVNGSRLRAYHMGPVGTGGPRTADESSKVDNLTTGVMCHSVVITFDSLTVHTLGVNRPSTIKILCAEFTKNALRIAETKEIVDDKQMPINYKSVPIAEAIAEAGDVEKNNESAFLPADRALEEAMETLKKTRTDLKKKFDQ